MTLRLSYRLSGQEQFLSLSQTSGIRLGSYEILSPLGEGVSSKVRELLLPNQTRDSGSRTLVVNWTPKLKGKR